MISIVQTLKERVTMDKLVRVEDVKADHRRFKGYLDEDMIARLNMTLENNVPIIQAIPLDLVKQAREEINAKMESIVGEYKGGTPFEQMPSAKIYRNTARKECIEILDKLIAESEGDNG